MDSLRLIAIQQPSAKEDILTALREMLDRCDVYSPTVTAFVIMSLAALKDHRALLAIEHAYRQDLVDESVFGWENVRSEFDMAFSESLTPVKESLSPSPYQGDEWMNRNLMILNSQFRADTLRFFILGSILRVEMTSPNELLEEVMTGFDEESVEFETDGQAKNFIRNYMGLWNELAQYQQQLFTLPPVSGNKDHTEARMERWDADLSVTRHTFWMLCFVDGLGFENRHRASLLTSQGRVLIDHVFDFLDVSCELPKDTSKEHKLQLVQTLREAWGVHYPALAKNLLQARLVIMAKKKMVDENRHVGRNAPCPCGSGKKFKKCCLM